MAGIRNALAPKLDKVMWEAICESPEQVNEAQAIESSVIEAAEAASSGSGVTE